MKLSIALLVAGLGLTFAQDQPAPTPARSPEQPPRPELPKQELQLVSPVGTIDGRLKRLDETVGLTAEQQTKLKAILAKNDAAMTAAVAAFRASHSKEDRQKLSALMKAQNAEVNAILTDAQKTKGQTAQNTIPSVQGLRPGSTGPGAPGAGRPIPAKGAIPVAPPPATLPPARTK